MPQLASGDILQCSFMYTQQGQRFLNVVHVEYFDAFGVTDDYSTFANQMLADWGAPGKYIGEFPGLCSTSISLDEVRIQKIAPTRLAPIKTTLNLLGLVGTGGAPCNVAATLTKRSLYATRWGLGSWHQPGLPASKMVNTGNWDTAWIDSVAAAVASTFQGVKTPTGASGNYQGVIYNPAVPTRKTPILSFDPQYTIRTMHRRTVRVGE